MRAESFEQTRALATAQDIIAVRADVERLRLEVQRDLAALKFDLLKWIIGLAIAQSALLMTIFAWLK